MSAVKHGIVLAFVLSSLSTAGCSLREQDSADVPPPPARKESADSGLLSVRVLPGLYDLKEYGDTGPGLIVCDPVLKGDGPNRKLAVGLGGWLRFTVMGIPQMGKSPMFNDANIELSRLDDRHIPQTLAHVMPGMGRLGATHAAIGELTENKGAFTLKYQVWDLATKAPAGAEVSASGSSDQITAALPGIARSLAHNAGVSNPSLSLAISDTAADLELVGSAPSDISAWSAQLRAGLAAAASRSSLCAYYSVGAFAGGGGGRAGGQLDGEETLARLAETNVQAMEGPVIYAGSSFFDDRLSQLRTRFPHNYALNRLAAFRSARTGGSARAVPVYTSAVRCNLKNVVAWKLLAASVGSEADELRQGRTGDRINNQEWQRLRQMYQAWDFAASKATQLDPQDGQAWFQVSQASCFAGAYNMAQKALWKSRKLARSGEKSSLYWWGMTIFDPQWLNDSANHTAWAKSIAADRDVTSDERVYIAELLRSHGFQELAEARLSTEAERAQYRRYVQANNARFERQQQAAAKTAQRRPVTRQAAAPQKSTVSTPQPASGQTERLHIIRIPKIPGQQQAQEVKRVIPEGVTPIGKHRKAVPVVAWSPDARLLASGGFDRTVMLWGVEGKQVAALEGHREAVVALAWSWDGKRLASASADGEIRIWDAATHTLSQALHGYSCPVYALAWTNGDGRLVTGGDDGRLCFWDTSSWNITETNKQSGPVRTAAVQPRGNLLIFSVGWGAGGTAHLWDTSQSRLVQDLDASLSEFHQIRWRPDGRQFAAACMDARVRTWDASGRPLGAANVLTGALFLVWSPDNKRIGCYGSDRKIHVLDGATGAEIGEIADTTNTVMALAVDPQSGRLATGGSDGSVLVWTSAAAQLLATGS